LRTFIPIGRYARVLGNGSPTSGRAAETRDLRFLDFLRRLDVRAVGTRAAVGWKMLAAVRLVLAAAVLGILGCASLAGEDDSAASESAVAGAAFEKELLRFGARDQLGGVAVDERGGVYIARSHGSGPMTMSLLAGDSAPVLPGFDQLSIFTIDGKAIYFAKTSDYVVYAADLDGRNIRPLGDPRPSSTISGPEFGQWDFSSYYARMIAAPEGVFVLETVIGSESGVPRARLLLLARDTWRPKEVARFDVEGDGVLELDRLPGATFVSSTTAPASVTRIGDDGAVKTVLSLPGLRDQVMNRSANATKLLVVEPPRTIHEIQANGTVGQQRLSIDASGLAGIQWSTAGLIVFSRDDGQKTTNAFRNGQLIASGIDRCWESLRVVKTPEREQLYCLGHETTLRERVVVRYDLKP
jgi:hypothetical protein